MIEAHFGESGPFSVGVEEEVMILDAATLEPAAAVDVLLRDASELDLPGTLKTEMHSSVVELTTGICADGDEAGDHLGWYCVRTDPFPCPAPDCTFVAVFMTAAHLVLVWEERDDPNLLRHAQRAKEVGRNPFIVSYESGYGPSASYYAWEAAGRPVHGIRRSK